LPDGNQNIVYCNFAGEIMLKVFHEVSPGGHDWITYHKYDEGTAAEVLLAHPSAVNGYDDTKADLLNNVNGNYQYLNDSSGLIETWSYAATTTATATVA